MLIELSMHSYTFLSLHTLLVPLLGETLVTFKPCSCVTHVFNTCSRILNKGKFMPAFEQMGLGGELPCFSIACSSKKFLCQRGIFWGCHTQISFDVYPLTLRNHLLKELVFILEKNTNAGKMSNLHLVVRMECPLVLSSLRKEEHFSGVFWM